MSRTQIETSQFVWNALAVIESVLASFAGAVLLAQHQKWFELNRYWVNSLYSVTGMFGVILLWLFFRAKHSTNSSPTDPPSKATVDAVTQTVGRDNQGKMIGKVEHYYEVAAQVQVPEIPQKAPEPAKRPKPNLVTKSPRKVYLDSSSRTLKLAESPNEGLLSLIIPVENLASEEDNIIAVEARNLEASIKFSREGVEYALVSTAYWIEHHENRINLPVAGCRNLVVGSYKTGLWSCYQNHRRDPFPEVRTIQQIRNLASYDCEPAEGHNVFLNPHVDVEIKVLSVGREGTSMLLKRLYRLSLCDDPHDFLWEVLPLK